MNLTRTSRVLVEGNSISALRNVGDTENLQYQWWYLQKLRADAAYGPVAHPAWIDMAIDGSLLSTIAARIVAEVALYLPTHFLVEAGVNDANTAVPLATSHANAVTILNASAGNPGVWLGPMCIGEKWPSGQNNATKDAAIDALDADLAALIAASYPAWTYVSARTLWGAFEAANNLPGPGITPFQLTTDGVHPTGLGRINMSNWVSPYVRLL